MMDTQYMDHRTAGLIYIAMIMAFMLFGAIVLAVYAWSERKR